MYTGVQQIMLGKAIKNESDAEKALAQIKAAGYDGLELNQFMIHPSSFLVKMMTKAAGMPVGSAGKLDWHRLMKESGLFVLTLHTDLGSIERDPAAVAEEAKSFGTDTLIITGMYRYDYSSIYSVKGLAERLNKAGDSLRKEGVKLLYHNHNIELSLLSGAGENSANEPSRAYDILISETDSDLVGFEFDSYWFTDGGGDVAWWMRRLGKRMKMWHVTDRGSRQRGVSMTPILKEDTVELGTGNMNLCNLRDIAVDNGVSSVVLETHQNFIENDPLKSLELSAKWLNKNIKGEQRT